MSTVPPIHPPPPPPPPPPPVEKLQASLSFPWWRKWSTWLVGVAGLSTTALATFAAWPQRLQDITPDWALGVLGALSMAYVLVPLATSLRQKP